MQPNRKLQNEPKCQSGTRPPPSPAGVSNFQTNPPPCHAPLLFVPSCLRGALPTPAKKNYPRSKLRGRPVLQGCTWVLYPTTYMCASYGLNVSPILPLLIATLRFSPSTLALLADTPCTSMLAETVDVELFSTTKYVLPLYFRHVTRSAPS